MYINKKTTASFDVDPQNTFTPLCPDELAVTDGHLIGTELNLNATKASIRIGSKDAHSPSAKWISNKDHPQFSTVQNSGPNVDIHWDSHAIIGSYGFEFLEGLPQPEEYDYFIWKGIEDNLHPYGACYHDLQNKMSTGVIESLYYNKISHVIVGGLAFDYCVKNTVLQLLEAGFSVIVNLSSTKAISEKGFDSAKKEMQDAGAIFVESANDIISN